MIRGRVAGPPPVPYDPGMIRKRAVLLGVGFDARDGHVRVTKGADFALLGGSEETHARMQDKAQAFQAELDRRGKRLVEVGPRELRAIVKKTGLDRG